MPGPGELWIVLLIVLVLFGGAKLPKLAQNLGESMKEFRKATKELESDDSETGTADEGNKA